MRPGTPSRIGHFSRGRYEEAANAARRAIQSNPSFSVPHSMLAAALVKLGRARGSQGCRPASAGAATILQCAPGLRRHWNRSGVG